MEEKTFKTIGIFNPKGGVGKTSLLASIAFELSKYGKTLVIDGDPQGSISYILLDKNYEKYADEQKDLLHLFKDEALLKDCVIQSREKADEFYGLDVIIPGNKKEFRSYISSTYQTEGADKGIRQIFEEAEKEGYSYVLYDLPGHLGQYERTVIAWLSCLLPITEAEDLSKIELESFLKEVRKIQLQYNGTGKMNSNLIINKVVKDNKVHEHNISVLAKAMPVFHQHIFYQTKIFSSSISQHLVAQEYQKNSKTSKTLEILGNSIK